MTRELSADDAQVRKLIDRWTKAVCDQDFSGILRDHDPAILMFDVPPPFLSRGVDQYMATWNLFFSSVAKPVRFDLADIEVTAGTDVAFATATGHCVTVDDRGKQEPLHFRLTMGFRKADDRWLIVHEHHSVPAE